MKLFLLLSLYASGLLACELKVGEDRLRLEKTECAFPTDELRPCYQLVARSGTQVSYGATPIFPGTPAGSYCIIAPKIDLFRATIAEGPRADIDCKTKKDELTLSWKGQSIVCPLPKK